MQSENQMKKYFQLFCDFSLEITFVTKIERLFILSLNSMFSSKIILNKFILKQFSAEQAIFNK